MEETPNGKNEKNKVEHVMRRNRAKKSVREVKGRNWENLGKEERGKL